MSGVCIICEGSQEDVQFQEFSPICQECVSRLVSQYDVEYSPPKKRFQLEGYLSLLLAIRRQSESDGELNVFERNWIRATPWDQILTAIYNSVAVSKEISMDLRSMVSHIKGL